MKEFKDKIVDIVLRLMGEKTERIEEEGEGYRVVSTYGRVKRTKDFRKYE